LIATMTTASTHDRPLPRWQRELLPAMLGADHADRGGADGVHLPRSLRDWVVDLIMFGFALALGAAGVFSNAHHAPVWWVVIDVLIGLAACGALWWRRDHPLAVGIGVILISTVSGMAGGASVVAMFTVAIYCRPRRTAEVMALSVAAAVIYSALYTGDGGYHYSDLFAGLAATVIAAAWGLFVRVRRELVLSLHERNRQLQAEQELRVQDAQRAERDRIAREMHDVLAHRISLLSLHAGALEYNPNASPDEIAKAAQVIRVSARAAQEELREVIGVLRADADERPLEPPQPKLAEIHTLVDESRRVGMDVRLDATLELEALPDTLGRTVYRLIQEALTNARKHAPEQLVSIELSGDQGAGVRVVVTNVPKVGSAPDHPVHDHVGSGTGLIGVGERVTLAGGTLTHGPLPGGGFQLLAELPWT
jgi:signal transduction histidine kinase